jgi:hypothetical protein
MMRRLLLLLISLCPLFLSLLAGAAAAPPPATGREVMEEMDRRQRTDSQYSEGIVTVEEKGKVRKKAWRSWRKGWGAEARSLVQFLEPPEVKGVGLLTQNHADRPDEQWFYTPAIDRDRRIAPQEKSTRFLGTHFTYEDMEERALDDYDYELLDGQPLEGADCWRVEATPRPQKESQYSKLILWVHKDRFVTVMVEGFVEGRPRRVFRGSDLADVDGIPTVRRWELKDARREGRTVLELRNIRQKIEIPPEDLTLQGMRVIHEPSRESRQK